MVVILFLDRNELMQPWFAAGTSCGDRATGSDDDSVSGQSAMERLRIPHGSPVSVQLPWAPLEAHRLGRLLS